MPATYNGQTDQTLKVKLASALYQAHWMDGETSANGEARLEVATTFVGDGAPVKITIKDQDGATVGNLDGIIWSNLFRATYRLADIKATALAFEAELPKHGLKKASGLLKVLPPLEFTNLKFTDPDGKALTELVEGKPSACEASVKGVKDGDPVDVRISLVLQKEAGEGTTFLESAVPVKGGKIRLLFVPAVRVSLWKIRVQQELDKEGGKYHHPEFVFSCAARGFLKRSDPAKVVQSLTVRFEERPGVAGKLEGKQVTLIAPDGKKEEKTIPKDGIIKIPKSQPGKYKVKGPVVKDLKAEESPSVPAGTVPIKLDKDEKEKLKNLIAIFESGKGEGKYAAINPDLEFEGMWDLPKGWHKTMDAPKEKGKKVRHSKYFDTPQHIGLSYGVIQFTQKSTLGEVLKEMQGRDSAEFEKIFGPDHKELVEVTNKSGKIREVEEEIFDRKGESLGKKMVKRHPRVDPVGGHELWEGFWTTKFKAAGKVKAFQEAQDFMAFKLFLDPIEAYLKKASFTPISQKSLCFLLDRGINEGNSKPYFVRMKKAKDEKKFWTDTIAAMSDPFIKKRLNEILKHPDAAWDVFYEIG